METQKILTYVLLAVAIALAFKVSSQKTEIDLLKLKKSNNE